MSLEIKAVNNYHDMMAFVGIPRSITAYKEMARPLPDRIENYDAFANPVHRHLKTIYFIALRDEVPVGRIAAIRDYLNPDSETGFFGCFECKNDAAAASALLSEARRWLADNGCPRMIGPATFNTNQQVGMLIEGFDQGPQIMLPYNPPYYGDLMEKSGLSKLTDLVTFGWRRELGIPQKISETAESLRGTEGISLRRFNFRNIVQEALLVRDMFNQSMHANWGFIPMTTDEAVSVLNYCLMYADRDLMVSVWAGDQPAGMLLFFPSEPPGRIPPRSVRAAILGVAPQFRHRGLDSYMIEYVMKTLIRKNYEYADLSLVHEENKVVIKILTQTIGSTLTRRYRVYTAT